MLHSKGLDARVLDMHTIKPLDADAVAQAARQTGAIVTVEEHTILGGLGGAVAEAASEVHPVPIRRVGLADRFAETGPYDRILDAYGIPPVPTALAHDAQAAARLAREMGFPVALKVASPDIPHKSDVGGVMLNLEDAETVTRGFETVMANARQAQPEAEIQGVYVQRMILSGQEVIIGAVQDPQFGALAMFGSGGVEVEGLKDVAFALAPLTFEEATHMLESTWAGRKLRGYRNLPPADRAAVTEALSHLAQLAADFPQIAEVEINPLCVLSEGEGVFAIDVRMRLDEIEK